MINLHATVRPLISSVNGDISATLRRSTGSTPLPGGKRVPTYADTLGSIQVQALSSSQLEFMNDLQMQGVMRRVYMYGDWGGMIRADKEGGDLLVFKHRDNPAAVWKIVTTFETWDGPGWSCVGVVLQ